MLLFEWINRGNLMEKIQYKDLDAGDLFRFYDARGNTLFYPDGKLKFQRTYKSNNLVLTDIYYPNGNPAIKCRYYKKHPVFGKQYVIQTWYRSGKKQLEASTSNRDELEWYILHDENGCGKQFNAHNIFVRRWDSCGNTVECKYRPNEKWIDIIEMCKKESVAFAQMDLFIDTIIRDLQSRGMISQCDYDFSFRSRKKFLEDRIHNRLR